MYELEEHQRRQIMERQMLDLLSTIAKSSDLTINQLKILNKNNPAPNDATSALDPQEFCKASDDIEAMEQAKTSTDIC